jgi:hypothetical protein
MKALQFLTALNERLHLRGDSIPMQDPRGRPSKSPGRMKKKKMAIDLLGRNPLHFLAVMGLTLSHLSKQSIDSLEVRFFIYNRIPDLTASLGYASPG